MKTSDRAAGAIMGAFIGDALGLGPHWYYDLAEQHRDYGPWITDYTEPRPGRYHAGLQAGDLSQSGLILEMLLSSLAEKKSYDEADFCRRLDTELLPRLDGRADHSPGGYSNHSIRQVWENRVKKGKPWSEAAGHADTSEGAERAALIAARYAADPVNTALLADRCCRVTQNDSLVVQQSVAFALVLASLIRGEPFDDTISNRLMKNLSGRVAFVSSSSIAAQGSGLPNLGFASPDALLLPSWIARAATDPDTRIEPAWKVSQVYGMSCAINFVLPAAYYLAVRFADDFESAVLHALNGGGQNMSRACLTGALVGAQVGLSGIPPRFIDGLAAGARLRDLARQVAGD